MTSPNLTSGAHTARLVLALALLLPRVASAQTADGEATQTDTTTSADAPADDPAADPGTLAPEPRAAHTPASPAPLPQDLIVRSDGTFARVSILSLDPDGVLTYVDVDGGVNTVEAASLAYFGPADQAPPDLRAGGSRATRADASAPPTGAGALHLRFESNVPVTVYRLVSSETAQVSGWTAGAGPFAATTTTATVAPVCETPCDATLPADAAPLAVRYQERGHERVRGDVRPVDGDTVALTYVDHRRTRIVVATLAASGMAAGIITSGIGFSQSSGDGCGELDSPARCDDGIRLSFIGLGVTVGSALGFLGVGAAADRATAEVVER
ncbi:MAG: hypothetical protein H6698_06850 [Myxococcales bacterium]|nr:hypothetical protein [Myxococcales bacterium]